MNDTQYEIRSSTGFLVSSGLVRGESETLRRAEECAQVDPSGYVLVRPVVGDVNGPWLTVSK